MAAANFVGQPANPTAHQALSLSNQSAFAALNSHQHGLKPICSNCKREDHSTDYCISPGGKMAGRSVEEASIAFKAALLKTQRASDTKP